MEMLIIEGNQRLSGEVSISGSKNAALPILVATLLSKDPSHLSNVPRLADTSFLFELLSSFGANYEINENDATIFCPAVKNSMAHYDVVRKMRASVLVLAPLLARTGEAIVSLPGGCAIGTRPVDIHLDGLKKLGADIDVKEGYIHAKLKNGVFIGNEFELPLPSVGATENLIMASVLAKGVTVLKKVAKEPEIMDLCTALNSAGAKIHGSGTNTLTIEGVSSLAGINHRISNDRIEAGTFMAIAAATKSSFALKNITVTDLQNVMERFAKAGMEFEHFGNNENEGLLIKSPEQILATDVETAAFPGFPTDMQAQFMAAMTLAKGTSVIYERIFENRMMHVPELRRMGANIEVKNGRAKVTGVSHLCGAPVMATDLRASASLLIAALAAHGKTEIRRVYHLDRGYEGLEKKLQSLNANITRVHQ